MWPGGPLHLNVQLDEPLVPDDRWVPDVTPGERPQPIRPMVFETIAPGPRTVVVAGDDAGPPARVLAEQANWPLLAEPTSGSRTGDNPIRCYRLLLDGELGRRRRAGRRLRPPDPVAAGQPAAGARRRDRARRRDARRVAGPAVPGRGPVHLRPADGRRSRTTRRGWRSGGRPTASVSRQLDALLAAEPDLTPYEVAGAVSRALPREGLLVVGASSPIRDLDLMVAPYEVGGRRKVIANRGLSGIDGTVSTAIGAALGRPSTSRTSR